MRVKTIPVLTLMVSLFTSLINAGSLENDWDEVESLMEKRQLRSATNVLTRIETKATQEKVWPDLAAAILCRTRCEHAITEENALDEERQNGLIAQYAERFEKAPAEIRPMLRMALAFAYIDKNTDMASPIFLIDGKGGPTELAKEDENLPPWANERIASTLTNLMNQVASDKAELQRQQVADWHRLIIPGDEYSKKCMPTLWDFIVNEAVRFVGIRSDEGELKAKVLNWLDDLAAIHSVEKEPDAHVYALYRKLQLEGGDKEKFAEKWFDVSAVSADAACAVAKNLSCEENGDAPIRAHKICERFYKRWPESALGRRCLSVMKELELPRFTVRTEDALLASGEQLEIKYGNLTNLSFRIIPMTFAERLDKELCAATEGGGSATGRKKMEKLFQRKPAAEWSASVEDKHDYLEHKASCPIPDGLKLGYYLLLAACNNQFGADGLPCECKVIDRTDLHLIERNDFKGWSGYVSDAVSGFPIADATVEFWRYDRKKDDYVLTSMTKSGPDGSWKIEVPKDANYGTVRAYKEGKGEALQTSSWWQRREPQLVPDKLHLVTDRAIYRPGQTVKFKGYAYHVDPKKRDFHVIANRRVFVELLDANGKRITELALVANDFGTFSGEFTAPRDRLTGTFELHAKLRGETGTKAIAEATSRVNVEEYKRPKFTVEFNDAEGFELGVETKLVGVAKTYTGLPVPDANVKWKVTRNLERPYWWYWWHNRDDEGTEEVASGECITDAKGEFVCTFVPSAPEKTKDEIETRYYFDCEAEVTDASGEMHSAQTDFTVGLVPWQLNLNVATEMKWRTPATGTPFEVWLSTNADDPVAGVEAEVKVYALKQPKRPVRKNLHNSGKEDSSAERWENGDMVQSAKFTTDKKGHVKGNFKLPAGAYRIEATVKTTDGKEICDKKFVRVIDPSAKSYSVMEPWYNEVEKSSVKVGDTARLFFGTGYESGYCRVRVMQGENVLAETTKEGTNWVYEFPVREEHRGTLAISIVFVRENRLYQVVNYIAVPWDNLELKITREHMTSKLLPDAKETWKFRVSGTDTNDVRRGVEALAFMYDKSLDALKRHCAYLPFDDNFSIPSSRLGQWKEANNLTWLHRWRGRWPETPGIVRISWPRWLPGTLQISERINRGWRDDGEMRMECMRSRSVPTYCYDAADDSDVCEYAVACCAAAAPVEMKCCVGRATFGVAGGSSCDEEKPDEEPKIVPRQNLQETAFFLPSLVSDENGIVEFSFTVPQALTGWRFRMLAHDRNLANGSFANNEIVTVKPLMVEPNGPRFVREGDVFKFPVKVTSTDDKPQQGKVTLKFFDAESGKDESRICREAKEFAFDLKAGETKTFEFAIAIPDGCGYLRYVAKASGREFTDGEEGFLPVMSRRVMVQESMPMQIRKAGERKFTFERIKDGAKSDTLKNVGLTAQVVSDPTWYAFLALPYLMEYPHECNEQIFSRYYANALAAKIANADPAYKAMFLEWEQAGANAVKSPLELNYDLKQLMLEATPWVRDAEDETKAKRHLGELFGSARLDAEQQRALELLRDNVADDGLWPWFPGGNGSEWVTMEILTGFARLEALGIKIDGQGLPMKNARIALDKRMEKDIAYRLEKRNLPFHICSDDLRWLYLQSFDKSWNQKYAKMLFECLEKEWTDFTIAGESLAAISLWRYGKKDLAKEIVKSLKERAVRSEEKGLYWKRAPFFDCSLFGAPVSDQALAMEAFLLVTPDDVDAYEDARIWLLEQKRTQNWSSTVSTCDAVYAILLGRGKTAPVKVGAVTMTLGDEAVPQEKVEAGTGFYEWRYAAEQVKPAMGDIVLSRKENALGWASVTWTYLEDATKVTAYEEKDLRITKTYYKKVSVKGKGKLVALGGGEKLMPGDELVARLAIDSNRIYEYVHLKDERPASAEPEDVISRYRWQDGLGFYQSTRDTATHYYFDRLPKGNFVLETSFRVRQQGTFSSGLATLECMYAPEFGAHSSASIIKVEKATEKCRTR